MQRRGSSGVLLALCAAALVLHGAQAVWDHGPIKPYATGAKKITGAGEGLPLWYRDDRGVMCELCTADPDAAGNAPCLTTKGFAGDIPDEAFYYAVTAEVVATSGANEALSASFENAVEAMYGLGVETLYEEVVFQRTRVRVTCPTEAPPADAPYYLEMITPHGEKLALTPAVEGGKSCIYDTIDVGVGALDFTANLAGPIGAFLIPTAKNELTDAQLGSFPDGSTTKPLLNGQPPRFIIYYPVPGHPIYSSVDPDFATKKYTNPFTVPSMATAVGSTDPATPTSLTRTTTSGYTLSTNFLTTSCPRYRGHALTVTRSELEILPPGEGQTASNVARLNVWVSATTKASGEQVVLTVPGGFLSVNPATNVPVPATTTPAPPLVKVLSKARSTDDALDPAVPSSFLSGLRPSQYFGSILIGLPEGRTIDAFNILLSRVTLAQTSLPITSTPPITGSATFNAATGSLTIVTNTRSTQSYSLGLFSAKGTFSELSAPKATTSGRKLLNTPIATTQNLRNSVSLTYTTLAAPDVLYACYLPITDDTRPRDCTRLRTQFTGSIGSSDGGSAPGTGGISTETLQPSIAISGSSEVVEGYAYSLDASGSWPSPAMELCTGTWVYKGADPTIAATFVAKPAEYTAAFTAPSVAPANPDQQFEFTLQCAGSAPLAPETRTVRVLRTPAIVYDLQANAVINTGTMDAASARAFKGLPIDFQFRLVDTNTNLEVPSDVAITGTPANCASPAWNAATRTLRCTPTDVAVAVQFSASGKPAGAPATVVPTTRTSSTQAVETEALTVGSLLLVTKEWRLEPRITSQAAVLYPNVKVWIYYTGTTNCDGAGDTLGVTTPLKGEACARRFYVFAPENPGVPCDTAGSCRASFRGAAPTRSPAAPATRPAVPPTPTAGQQVYVYIVSNSGYAASHLLSLKT